MLFNRFIAWTLPLVPKALIRGISRNYIAGETLEEALAVAHDLNRQGCGVTLDLLGEDPLRKEDCYAALEIYGRTLDRIQAEGLGAGISVKPSHMGLKLDKDFCRFNLKSLVEKAGELNRFVRIDMEDASLCDATLGMFRELSQEHNNVGLVLQAYLRRAMADARTLGKVCANVRLCKGAYYWEAPSVVYGDPWIINSSYAHLLEQLFRSNCFVAVATHDERLVFEALRLIDLLEIPREQYEFQMLHGVGEKLRGILLAQGHPVRVYVPFGRDWFAYSLRRLRENPRVVGYVAAQIMGRLTGGIKRG